MDATGIPGFDWALVELYAVAVALGLGSALWRSPGTRVRGVLVVPLVVGLACIVVLALTFAGETRTFLHNVGDHAASVVVLGFAVLVAAACADFLVARVARSVAGTQVVGGTIRAVDAACAVTLLIPLMVGVLGLVKIDERTRSAYELSQLNEVVGVPIEAEHEMPGEPMDVALRNPSEGYVSLLDGRIARFVLADQGRELEYTIEATGLESPRGLAVVGDSLVVAEQGQLPCKPQFPCKGGDVDGASSMVEAERKILRESSARLVRFDIRQDGRLARRQTILDHLPVANSEHGVNAVTAGTDGRVYVTVGNSTVSLLPRLTRVDRGRPNFDLLGVALSLRPNGTDVQIVAHGLRNVYDVSFDDDGRLYGVDNDGETRTGWRREEVLEIKKGANYGYPFDGTFAPSSRRTVVPLWVLDTVGSAGIEWLRWEGQPTLVVGSCGSVDAITLAEAHGTGTVKAPSAVRRILSGLPGCVTAIERISVDRLLVSLFAYGGPPLLYVVRLES